MRALLQTTAVIGTTEILLMGVALARNKYLAVTIGPEGFGIYGLLNSFFMMMAVFAGTWMATGTTKYVAEYHAAGDQESANKVFTFSVATTAGIALLLTAILVVERKCFLAQFLSEDVKENYYLIFCFAFVALNLRPVLLAVLQGMRRVREVVISRWSIAGLDLIFVVILVLLFGLAGFFVSLLLSACWAVVVMIWAVQRKDGLQLKKISCREPVIRLLLSFGGVNLFLALINLGSQYLQRVIVLLNMDILSVGLFQAGVALMGYLGVVNRGTMFYYFPKMSELIDNNVRNQKINEYLRFLLIISIPLSVLAILFGRLAISILYSSAFDALSSVFFWFVIGKFLNSVGGAFQMAIVGMARLKMHTASSIVIHSLWVIVPFLLVKKYGIGALGMGFVAGGIAGPILNYFYLRRCIDLRLSGRVIRLFAVAALTLTGTIILKDTIILWRIGWAIISCSLIGTSVSSEEWAKGYRYVLVRLGKSKI